LTEATALLEAIAAINRTVATRGERNFSGATALGANSRVHLALAALSLTSAAKVAALLARGTASRATAWLVLEAFFGIKFLFAGGEIEVYAAISTFKGFVFKHGYSSSVFLLCGLGTAWHFDLSAGKTGRGERARVA
jgi:heme/copper-type cytochrome/quinol oxidase subunit 3